jgi:hypothetical protein
VIFTLIRCNVPAEGLGIEGTRELVDPQGRPWPDWQRGMTGLAYIRSIDSASVLSRDPDTDEIIDPPRGFRTTTHLTRGVIRVPTDHQAPPFLPSSFGPDQVFAQAGATGGKDLYVRAQFATWVPDQLSPGDGHAVNLNDAINVSQAMWMADVGWSLRPEGGWSQTPNYSTAPDV